MPTDQTSMRALPTKIPFLTKTQKEPSAQIECAMSIWTAEFDFLVAKNDNNQNNNYILSSNNIRYIAQRVSYVFYRGER